MQGSNVYARFGFPRMLILILIFNLILTLLSALLPLYTSSSLLYLYPL